MITVLNIATYSEVADAAVLQRKIKGFVSDPAGEYAEIEGTLRRLCREPNLAHAARGTDDIEKLWVQITLVQGGDIWVSLPELVEARRDGLVKI